jgi:hypothetical protein
MNARSLEEVLMGEKNCIWFHRDLAKQREFGSRAGVEKCNASRQNDKGELLASAGFEKSSLCQIETPPVCFILQ